MKYDLALFLELNEEYRTKPLVPSPPRYDAKSLAKRSASRAMRIDKAVPISDKRVLEIGCGRGEVCRTLSELYDCETVGVDVSRYREWQLVRDRVKLVQTDLSAPDAPDLGKFDVIYSNSVWEHLRHPFAMLKKSFDLLKPGGVMLLSANLYRGPKASHRYREVFFPWPHLLFSDEVFEEFYVHLGSAPRGDAWVNPGSLEPGYKAELVPKRAAWVNQLSIADYYLYFHLVGFDVRNVRFSVTPLDEKFLTRFADKLDRFPRYDLERDFIHVELVKTAPPFEAALPEARTAQKMSFAQLLSNIMPLRHR
jgi:SAM-dependent methyltransferase